jgi:hypothetical protein
MSDLEQLQKNLNYKVKSEEIGLASWKGSHGKPQPMFIPTKDYLLNNASRQQDQIKKRNDMIDEYLDEQRTPIYRYDEFGDVITDVDGNPIEYKFHGIPPPTLDLTALAGSIYDPVLESMQNINLSGAEQKKFLTEKDEIIERVNTELDGRIREYRRDDVNLKRELIRIEERIQQDEEEIKRLYEIENLANRKKIIKNIQNRQRFALADKKSIINAIEENKENIFNMIQGKERFTDDVNDLSAQIQNKLKENERKVKTYNEELNALNRGELNTSKSPNETDEEYALRLQQMADVPFADRRSEEKAINRQKEKLRENLKLLIRNNATISQVVNSISSTEPLLLAEINKFFAGFKDYFIKKFGENNEKINYRDIINEITFYLRRATDPRVLSGNVTNPEEIAEKVISRLPRDVIPYQQPAIDPDAESTKDIIDSFQRFVDATSQNIKKIKKVPSVGELTGEESEEGGEESSSEEEKEEINIESRNIDNGTTMVLSFNGKNIYIKYTLQNKEVKLQLMGSKTFEGPIFFLSATGEPNSFTNIKYNILLSDIAKFLSIPVKKIRQFMGVYNYRNLKKDDVARMLANMGLKPSKEPKVISSSPLTIGYGIKKADNLPDKVPFGSNILLLKKLFLKNILSIQNKHNTKINGFNNVHVSDNFVKIIMNLLKGVNFTNSELQNLTNNERLLLDNLLMLSELNKKFVTGSSTASLNQLKKDYEILIGEIDAGNNNEILKKKLYNILMRMVHFGALSQIQALKHYKEILKSHF